MDWTVSECNGPLSNHTAASGLLPGEEAAADTFLPSERDTNCSCSRRAFPVPTPGNLNHACCWLKAVTRSAAIAAA
jgi:hypothetical protein